MFGCSKLVNHIFTIGAALILTILIAIEIPLIVASDTLTNKDNVKRWLKSEDVRPLYADYIVDQLYEQNNSDLIALIVEEDELKSIVAQELNSEWIDRSIDSVVDSTYKWLEGDEDKPIIDVLQVKEGQSLVDVESLAQERLGKIANFIDFDEVNELSGELSILGLDPESEQYIPQLYQKLKTGPQQVGIAIAVVAAVILLSSMGLRSGLTTVTLAGITAAGIIIFAPGYIRENPGEIVPLSGYLDKLPRFEDLPTFVQRTSSIAGGEMYSDMRRYAFWLLVGAIGLFIITQLTVRTVEDFDEEE